MTRGDPTVISLVERGWHAARECSLALQRDEIGTLHLAKGQLSPEVFKLVGRKPGIELVGVPYQCFWPVTFFVCQWMAGRGRLHAVLVDNERSRRRVSRWFGRGANRVVMVRETDEGWRCVRGGREFPMAAYRDALGIHERGARL